MAFTHISVLLHQAIDCLNVQPKGIYIDATAGGGGHSLEIARRLEGGRLIAIDKDPDAAVVLKQRLSSFPMVTVVMDDFKNIALVANQQKVTAISGVLLDLGVSSHQLDTAARGFSYHSEAPLDMRMAQKGLSAQDVVNEYPESMLERIFREYGEERFSRRVAQAIITKRNSQPIVTTTQLAEIIKQAISRSDPTRRRTPRKTLFSGHSHRGQRGARCSFTGTG
jgi:16S rRNA (cytosine1402-N4)-methyltransferase